MNYLLESLIFKFIIFIGFFLLSDHDYCYSNQLLLLRPWYCMITIVFILLKGTLPYFWKLETQTLFSVLFLDRPQCQHVTCTKQRYSDISEREAQIIVGSALPQMLQKSDHCHQLLPKLGGHWREDSLCTDSQCRSAVAQAWEVT